MGTFNFTKFFFTEIIGLLIKPPINYKAFLIMTFPTAFMALNSKNI